MEFTIVGSLPTKEEAEEVTAIAKRWQVGLRAQFLSRQAKMDSTAHLGNKKT